MEEQAKGAGKPAFPAENYAYYVIGVLMIAYTFSYLDRFIFSLMVDPVRKDLNLTDTEMGLVGGTSFAICFVLVSFPFGRWADLRGRRNVIAIGTALWSIATMLCGLANSFWRLFFARMLVGVGEASLNPAVYSLIPDYFPPHRRGFATALYATGVSIGGGIAFLAGGYLIDFVTKYRPAFPFVGDVEPWQFVFLAVGFPGILVALLVYLTVREPERQTSTVDPNAPTLGEVWLYLRTHKKMFLLTFGGFSGFAIGGYAFQFWGPAFFMRMHGFSASEAGLLFGIGFGVLGTGSIILGGLWSDWLVGKGRIDGFARVALWSAAIQMVFFVISYLVVDTMLAVIAFGIGMIGACLIGGLQGAMIQAVTPNRMRGIMGAIYGTVVNLGGLGVAPALTAFMSDSFFGGNLGPALAVTTIVSMSQILILVTFALPTIRARVAALHN